VELEGGIWLQSKAPPLNHEVAAIKRGRWQSAPLVSQRGYEAVSTVSRAEPPRGDDLFGTQSRFGGRFRGRRDPASSRPDFIGHEPHEPDAPDGPWYKDFGSFKICGEGEFPKTFLFKGQPAKGKAR